MPIQKLKVKSQNCCAPAARYHNAAKRHLIFAFCILIFAFACSGCARTVTQLVTYGDQMVVEVTLRGDYDADSNRYFMVLSDRSDYRIPLPPPDILEDSPEMLEPGETPSRGSPEAYYANFYSSWSGYIIVDPTGYSLVKGPFTLGSVTTRESLANLADTGNKLVFSFRLQRMFASVPDQIYFDVVAVPWPDGGEKIPGDHLPSTDNYISKVTGSITTVADTSDGALSADLDITGCKVEIE